MKKTQTLSRIAPIIMALTLVACQKTGRDPYQPVEAGHYRIEKIIVPADQLVASNRRAVHVPTAGRFMTYALQPAARLLAGTSDTMVFAYNSAGNPVSMTHVKDFGAENALFKYDYLNRLSEYMNIYPNGAGDYWHRYTYDLNNHIIADTAYRDFYAENGKMLDYGDIDLTTFKYDTYGRITRSTEYVLGDTNVVNYSYNANGDWQNGSTYDNKLSLHLINKNWMFIDRIYSLNNPVNNGVYTYNTAGLPLTINTNNLSEVAGFTFTVIGHPFGFTKAIYIYSHH